MKNCVIYGAWLRDGTLTNMYLNSIKHYLHDCDFYVGFNNSTNPLFVSACLKNLPVVAHKVCDRNLEVSSDASAYQAALECYMTANKSGYENIYFIHNKGASHFAMSYFNDYLIRFLQSRKEVDETLNTYGGYCLYGGLCDDISKGWNDLIKNTSKFTYETPCDIMWWCTVYAIKAKIVNKYLENIDKSFFTTKLDRYFFEASFPLIVDKFGFSRYTKHFWDNPKPYSQESLDAAIKKYKEVNKI